MKRPQKLKVVAVSGGFDPIHIGHVRLLKAARALGDRLVVILNNDNWLRAKKGFAFMPETERKEILQAFPFVDKVMLSKHGANGDYQNPLWRSVCRELEEIQPDIFANGGDRALEEIPEAKTCRENGITMVFNVGEGGKVSSSSHLAKTAAQAIISHGRKKSKRAV